MPQPRLLKSNIYIISPINMLPAMERPSAAERRRRAQARAAVGQPLRYSKSSHSTSVGGHRVTDNEEQLTAFGRALDEESRAAGQPGSRANRWKDGLDGSVRI